MLQAMNTGHDGSLATVHANSPKDSLARIETMVLMSGMDLPVKAIREQVASAIDMIIHQTRLKDGTRRITQVTEVLGMAGGDHSDRIELQDIFRFDFQAGLDQHNRFRGTLVPTGVRPRFLQKLADAGISVPDETFVAGEAKHRWNAETGPDAWPGPPGSDETPRLGWPSQGRSTGHRIGG
jgi:pilus assembly protein CpaF